MLLYFQLTESILCIIYNVYVLHRYVVYIYYIRTEIVLNIIKVVRATDFCSFNRFSLLTNVVINDFEYCVFFLLLNAYKINID